MSIKTKIGLLADFGTLIDLFLRFLPIILAGYKFFSSNFNFDIALKTGALSFFIVYPIIGMVRFFTEREKWISRLSNPYISVKKQDISCTITEERGCVRRDTIVIQAMRKGIKDYKLFDFKTPAKNVKVILKKGGILTRTPFPWMTEYTIHFNELKKGTPHTIVVEYKVGDLIEAPYLSISLGSSREYQFLIFKVDFPLNDIPRTIYKYINDTTTRKVINYPKEIRQKKGEVVWKVSGDKLNSNCEYTIYWEWKNMSALTKKS